jgi:hypothetical protein
MGLNDEDEKRQYAFKVLADPDSTEEEKAAAREFLQFYDWKKLDKEES